MVEIENNPILAVLTVNGHIQSMYGDGIRCEIIERWGPVKQIFSQVTVSSTTIPCGFPVF